MDSRPFWSLVVWIACYAICGGPARAHAAEVCNDTRRVSSSHGRSGVVLLQVHGGGITNKVSMVLETDLHEAAHFSSPIMLRQSGCLAAPAPQANGSKVQMWSCIASNPDQLWSYDSDSGHIVHSSSGMCLQAPFPLGVNTAVQLWDCSSNEPKQQWHYDTSTGVIKLRSGICLDAYLPAVNGGLVHLWACDSYSPKQQWLLGPQAMSLPHTTATITTTSVETPLEAARNCYLAPLVPGSGCNLLVSLEDPQEFGLSTFGQDTAGRQTCLNRMREHQGNTFVFQLGRCEVWGCSSKTALFDSAANGVAMGSVSQQGTETVMLRSFQGHYFAAEADGSVHARAAATDPAAVLSLVPLPESHWGLQSAFGHFITATPEGTLRATAQVADKWEQFNLIDVGAGLVALQSTHGRYMVAEQDGDVHANRAEAGSRESWQLANRISGDVLDAVIQRRLLSSSTSQAEPANKTFVFSQLCRYQEPFGGYQGKEKRAPVIAKLWEWNYVDIGKECSEFLGPNQIDAVQISPVTEHILGDAWWTKYQPVSAGLDSRSGTAEEFASMVGTCRSAGVQVMVDVVMNHIASPCKEASGKDAGTPCSGWAGGRWGNRRMAGVGPEQFHHYDGVPLRNCQVGPPTAWLCDNEAGDCTTCDMYGLPDWNTAQQAVRDSHAAFLEQLFLIGVTMLRIDGAIYMHVVDLAAILNRFPWDFVFQEWWGEFPPADRQEYVGHFRDVAYRGKMVEALAVNDVEHFPDLLNLGEGVFGIAPEVALYPMAYHDGRSNIADPAIATYKNGLEYHQQQKFFLAWPTGMSMVIWSGYSWSNQDQGPPGCEKNTLQQGRCQPQSVFTQDGPSSCLVAPSMSPLLENASSPRTWVCEHRWQGVAGLVHFRKSCRGLPVTASWAGGRDPAVALGRVAFRLGEDSNSCFVALVRGYNEKSKPAWGHLGEWPLQGLETGLPAGRYCDLSSLYTQSGWDKTSCPREVVLGPGGVVQSGTVPEGDIVAIHAGARLP